VCGGVLFGFFPTFFVYLGSEFLDFYVIHTLQEKGMDLENVLEIVL